MLEIFLPTIRWNASIRGLLEALIHDRYLEFHNTLGSDR